MAGAQFGIDALRTTRRARTMALYVTMPGAPRVPYDGTLPLWAEVEGNDHWQFCEAVIDAIITAAEIAR